MTIATDRAEADINRHSATFKKELGLRDLVLTQVVTNVAGAMLFVAARRRQRAAMRPPAGVS